jgi:hypothetical protein
MDAEDVLTAFAVKGETLFSVFAATIVEPAHRKAATIENNSPSNTITKCATPIVTMQQS